MAIPDRIRLTGLLRENPAFAGFSYLSGSTAVHHPCITPFAIGTAIRRRHDRDPFVHGESVDATSPIPADLTVVCRTQDAPGPTLLDLDDPPRREIEQRGWNSFVRGPKVVHEECARSASGRGGLLNA